MELLVFRLVADMASPLWIWRMTLPSSLRTTGFGDCSPSLLFESILSPPFCVSWTESILCTVRTSDFGLESFPTGR